MLPPNKSSSNPVKTFVSYSRKDKELWQSLNAHLQILVRQEKLEPWSDREIEAGTEWEPLLRENLESAQIILLLISSDFIASKYCYEKEMMRAIERHDQGTAKVIPILLRSCVWEGSPFSKIQSLPENNIPINESINTDKVLAEIVKVISRTADNLSTQIPEVNLSEKSNSTTTGFSESQEQNTTSIDIEEFGNQWIARQVEEYYIKWEKRKDDLHLLPNHLVVFLNANELAKTREYCEKLKDFKSFFNESCKMLEKSESDENHQLLENARKAEDYLLSSEPRTGLFKALQVFNSAKSKNVHVIQNIIRQAMELSKEKHCIGRIKNIESDEEGRKRHTGAIKCVNVSPDGKYIVSSGRDKKIFLWRSNGDYICSINNAHNDAIWKVLFSPLMNYIVSASEDGTIKLWYLESDINKELNRISNGAVGFEFREPRQGNNRSIRSLSISPDGRYLVAGSKDYNAYIWQLNESERYIDPEHIATLPHEDWVMSTVFSSKNKYVYCGCADNNIYCWKIDSTINTQKPKKLSGHTGWVRALAINKEYLVSGSEDKTIRLWDLSELWEPSEDGKLINSIQTFNGHEDKVLTVDIDTNGEFIISGSADKTIQLWDFYGNKVGYPLRGHGDWVRSLSVFSDDEKNKFIVSSSRDATIRIWDLHRNSLAKILSVPNSKRVISVAITHNENKTIKYIVSAGEDRTIHLWYGDGTTFEKNFINHQKETDLKPKSIPGKHSQWIRSVRFTPDEKHVVTGSQDSSIGTWNFETNRFRVSTDYLRQNEIDEEEKSSSSNVMDDDKAWIRSIDISSDGKYLISASDKNAFCIWDLNENWESNGGFLYKARECFFKHNNRVTSVAFSPENTSSNFLRDCDLIKNDSRYIIASASEDKTVRLWDLEGNEIKKLEGHTKRVISVKFSRDGRYLVSGSQDKKIRLWDLKNLRKNPIEYPPHDDAVRTIAFSLDSKFIISGSSDTTIRIWDLYGKQIGSSLTGHRDSVRSLKVSLDGKFIVSGSEDGTVRLWNLGELKDWVEICCNRIINNPDSEQEHQELAEKILSNLPNLAC
jgi:WD40 repeat protein